MSVQGQQPAVRDENKESSSTPDIGASENDKAPEPDAVISNSTVKPAIVTRKTSESVITRQGLHEKLRAYEARRRLASASKFDSSSLYWKSFRDLLGASVQETGRAQRLVLGTSRAHQLYADAMQAMYEDVFLDEKGNVILRAKQQKRLQTTRKKPAKKGSDPKKDSILTGIREAQHVMAERFGENAKNMDEEIAEEIGDLLEELKKLFSSMENLGNAILTELEKTEHEVVEAWGTYYSMALKSFSGGLPPMNSAASQALPQEAAPHISSSDVWIVEMQYRVAVAYQNTAWEKGNAELTQLFQTMKEEECRRRIHLREYLVAFVQRQQRLFLSLPSVHSQVLEDLVGHEMTREEVEEAVQEAIRERAKRIQRANDKTPKKSNAGPGLEGVNEDEGDFTLESPLVSDLLCKAKVIERRNAGVMKGWKTALAIVTADSFLHLFDLPPGTVQPGSAPEVAFQYLIPIVGIPSSDNLAGGKTNFSKAWSASLSPTDSLILGNCKIQVKNDSAFEITETMVTKGAQKMFGKTATRKMILRTMKKTETEDWLSVLKG